MRTEAGGERNGEDQSKVYFMTQIKSNDEENQYRCMMSNRKNLNLKLSDLHQSGVQFSVRMICIPNLVS
jgi:hypothetical protein